MIEVSFQTAFPRARVRSAALFVWLGFPLRSSAQPGQEGFTFLHCHHGAAPDAHGLELALADQPEGKGSADAQCPSGILNRVGNRRHLGSRFGLGCSVSHECSMVQDGPRGLPWNKSPACTESPAEGEPCNSGKVAPPFPTWCLSWGARMNLGIRHRSHQIQPLPRLPIGGCTGLSAGHVREASSPP